MLGQRRWGVLAGSRVQGPQARDHGLEPCFLPVNCSGPHNVGIPHNKCSPSFLQGSSAPTVGLTPVGQHFPPCWLVPWNSKVFQISLLPHKRVPALKIPPPSLAGGGLLTCNLGPTARAGQCRQEGWPNRCPSCPLTPCARGSL